MKKCIAAAGILAMVMATQNAGAKTLEEVLKEKGVITESDYNEIMKEKPKNAPFAYKMGKGFTFTSTDEKFQLSINGRMQVRYTYADNEVGTNISKWELKRVKFNLGGYAYTKDLTYALYTDLTQSNSNKLLEDVWLNYRVLDEVQLRAGQAKTAFVRQEMISDGSLQMVDRSIAVDSFKHGRDTGLTLWGKAADGLLSYSFGIDGGMGQGYYRSNATNNMLVARAEVNPFGPVNLSEGDFERLAKPKVSLGASWFSNTLATTGDTTFEPNNTNYATKGWLYINAKNKVFKAGGEKVDIDSIGIDAVMRWMGVSLQSEYFLGYGKGQVSGYQARAQGFYVQSGVFVLPKKLELELRYSFVDPNRAVANNLQSEVAGGVSWYFDEHRLKIQGDIADIHQQTGVTTATDDMQYRVQAQLTF